VYNGYTTDVTTDLNTPRPIIAGGTGASSADAALTALGGEKAGQVVTNYDSHVFVAGSFLSAPGATGAPESTAYYAGVCYMASDSAITLEARQQGPQAAGAAGKLFIRHKWTTWSAWSEEAGTQAAADARYVNVAGDTMTGDLTAPSGKFTGGVGSGAGTTIIGGFGAAGMCLEVLIDSVPKATIQSYNRTSNAWQPFTLASGGLTINNNGGNLTNSGWLVNNGPVVCATSATSGICYFGSSAANYLNYDGTNFTLLGGAFYLGSGALYPHPNFGIQNNGILGDGTTTPYRAWSFIYTVAGASIQQSAIYPVSAGWYGWDFACGTAEYQFRHDATAGKSGGATTWVITSDERIKTVTEEYTTGLDAIAALRPVRYVYNGKGAMSAPSAEAKPAPPPEVAELTAKAAAMEYIGLVAQEAETVLPDCFKTGEGYIDGKKVDDMRSAEYTPLFFALVNAVKELKARIEELEAR
jgi:hypothetical protein